MQLSSARSHGFGSGPWEQQQQQQQQQVYLYPIYKSNEYNNLSKYKLGTGYLK